MAKTKPRSSAISNSLTTRADEEDLAGEGNTQDGANDTNEESEMDEDMGTMASKGDTPLSALKRKRSNTDIQEHSLSPEPSSSPEAIDETPSRGKRQRP